MKTEMTKVSLAIAGVLASSMAFAQDDNGSSGAQTTTEAENYTYVNIEKSVANYKYVDVSGTVAVTGTITVKADNKALVDNKQYIYDNSVENPDDPTYTTNLGTVDGNAGNIGVNAATGETNQQDNAAALSSSDQDQFFGAADAESFVQQKVWDNTANIAAANYRSDIASVNTNTGNVGVNVTAGNFNGQKNSLAVASSASKTGVLVEATAATLQESTGIYTKQSAAVSPTSTTPVSYTAQLLAVNDNAGNVGVNISAGNNNLQSNTLAIAKH